MAYVLTDLVRKKNVLEVHINLYFRRMNIYHFTNFPKHLEHNQLAFTRSNFDFGNTKTMCEIFSKLTIKTADQVDFQEQF